MHTSQTATEVNVLCPTDKLDHNKHAYLQSQKHGCDVLLW